MRRGNSGYAGFLARAGRLPSWEGCLSPGGTWVRGRLWSVESSGCWDAPSPLASSLKHPEPDRDRHFAARLCRIHGLAESTCFQTSMLDNALTSRSCGVVGGGLQGQVCLLIWLPSVEARGGVKFDWARAASFLGKQPWVGGL